MPTKCTVYPGHHWRAAVTRVIVAVLPAWIHLLRCHGATALAADRCHRHYAGGEQDNEASNHAAHGSCFGKGDTTESCRSMKSSSRLYSWRSDTNRLLSSKPHSRKTRRANASRQLRCHRSYRVSLRVQFSSVTAVLYRSNFINISSRISKR